jgi:hypothetical protein
LPNVPAGHALRHLPLWRKLEAGQLRHVLASEQVLQVLSQSVHEVPLTKVLAGHLLRHCDS